MTLSLNALLAMALRSIRNPREGAEEVLALGVPREALWTSLILVIVLSILLAQLTAIIVGFDAVSGVMSPMATGIFQFAVLLVMVFAIHTIGRAMGGKGSFEEGLLLVAWLQFVMVLVQIVQTVVLVILPPLAGVIGILGVALFLWMLTNFVTVLHGFRSTGQVFAMILVSAFGIAFALSIVLTILGVTGPMMGRP